MARHYGSHFEKKSPESERLGFILDMFTVATGGLELSKIHVFMVINLTKVYDKLEFCSDTNTFYSAKRQSFHITSASFTPA